MVGWARAGAWLWLKPRLGFGFGWALQIRSVGWRSSGQNQRGGAHRGFAGGGWPVASRGCARAFSGVFGGAGPGDGCVSTRWTSWWSRPAPGRRVEAGARSSEGAGGGGAKNGGGGALGGGVRG